MSLKLQTFFDKATYTLTYIVFDENTKDAIIIDPVLDYEPAASKVSTESVDKVVNFVKENDLVVHYILETHAHADHLTGAAVLKERIPQAKIAIGERITEVQEVFKDLYNLKKLVPDGHQFDLLLKENETIKAGSIELKTIFTPGHTPACSSYLVEDMLFTGDVLFMPDSGTGRCDFPKGSAEDLYHSVKEKLYKLPETTRTFTGHDYQPNGRELKFESSIAEHKKSNIHLKEETSKDEYVSFRTGRDSGLSAPKLLLQSLQVNIDAGHLPEGEDNGMVYFKIPVKK